MAASGAPTVRQRRLAAELRRLRANRTGDEVAAAMGWSPSKVSRYELARTGPNLAEVGKLLDYYGITGPHREQVLALAREATLKGWWEAYSDALPEELVALIALEDEASSSWMWQVEVIPGLLQTEEYARQIISVFQGGIPLPPTQVERRVEARLRRQNILTRDDRFEFSVVLDESVILRRHADTRVMRLQLRHLVDVSKLPNVTVQVFPLQTLHPVITSSFLLLQFGRQWEEAFLHDVVSIEHLQSNLHFEGEVDTHMYRLAFQALSDAALDPEQSRELILRTSQQVWA